MKIKERVGYWRARHNSRHNGSCPPVRLAAGRAAWPPPREPNERVRPNTRDSAKFGMQLEELRRGLSDLFEGSAPRELLIVLGSSSTQAKEVYRLVFSYSHAYEALRRANPRTTDTSASFFGSFLTERQLTEATKKMLRSIFANSYKIFENSIRPSKLFVVARLVDSPAGQCPDGFLVKPTFSLKVMKQRGPRSKHKMLQPAWSIGFEGPEVSSFGFEGVHHDGLEEEHKSKEPHGGATDLNMFCQWRVGLKGFRVSEKERSKVLFGR